MAGSWKSPKTNPVLKSVKPDQNQTDFSSTESVLLAGHGTTDKNRKMPKSNKSEVDDYIAKASEPAQQIMKQIRATIRSVAPEADEKMSYGIPFYEYKFPGYKGRLAYFGAYKNHVSFYAVPHTIPPALDKQLEKYKAAKATLQFPIGTKVPVALLKQLVKLRKDEIDALS